MSLYLLLNLASVSIPFIFSFHPKLKFYKTWTSFLPALFISAFIFILWDIAFTSMGIWGFNPVYLEGIYIKGLPVEEILFFICIPYASLFSVHAFTLLFPRFSIKAANGNDTC
jgi:lycopene cyclase domain-containing protein